MRSRLRITFETFESETIRRVRTTTPDRRDDIDQDQLDGSVTSRFADERSTVKNDGQTESRKEDQHRFKKNQRS